MRSFCWFLVLSLCLLVSCARSQPKAKGTAAGAGAPEVLELRYQGNNGTVVPAELAEDLGYLAPIRLEFVGSTVSGPQSIQAVVTGDTDFGGAFNGAVVKLVAAKAPIRAVVGYYGVDDKRWSGFYVQDNSPIRSARDLLGKKVSMNTVGAHSYGVAGKGGLISEREFQVWIDWMIRDGDLTPGQLSVADLYTNVLNPFVEGKSVF